MIAPIPHNQLKIGQQIWIVSKNLDWLVEYGIIISLPDFENPYVGFKNNGGFCHWIYSNYQVFDNEETALREAAALLKGTENEVYERLLEINKNKGEKNE